MKSSFSMKQWLIGLTAFVAILAFGINGCKPQNMATAVTGDAAGKVYVAPGKYDEFYNFVSGGFSGQMAVYGLPSGRLLKVLPVFSVNPESGYGYSEELKPMLNTSHGEVDGRWLFGNGNNPPRIARIDLKTFRTTEIIEIPNSSGNHSSPFITENTEYVIAGTRFSYPMDDKDSNPDVSIDTYKENFKGTVSFVGVEKETGHMDIAFQII